jgi:hypothetical protein
VFQGTRKMRLHSVSPERPPGQAQETPANDRDSTHGCYQVLLGLLECLQQPSLRCESAASKFVSGASTYSNSQGLSNNQIMKSNNAALRHLDCIFARPCRAICLSPPGSMCLILAICFRVLDRFEYVYESIPEARPSGIHSTTTRLVIKIRVTVAHAG